MQFSPVYYELVQFHVSFVLRGATIQGDTGFGILDTLVSK